MQTASWQTCYFQIFEIAHPGDHRDWGWIGSNRPM